MANATIVARLVPSQKPDAAYDALAAHIRATAAALYPPGVVQLTISRLGFAAAPVVSPASSPANAAVAGLLTELYNGITPVHKRMGGSIPAVGIFAARLGAATTGLAVTHPGCGPHAPDEHVAAADLDRGRDAYAAVLFRLAAAMNAAGGGGRHEEL